MDQVLKQAEMQLQTMKRDETGLTFAYVDDIGLVTNQPTQLQGKLDVWTKVLTMD